MKCLFCHKGPPDGVALYRVNLKGVTGVWACSVHIQRTDSIPHPELFKLVEAIKRGARHRGVSGADQG